MLLQIDPEKKTNEQSDFVLQQLMGCLWIYGGKVLQDDSAPLNYLADIATILIVLEHVIQLCVLSPELVDARDQFLQIVVLLEIVDGDQLVEVSIDSLDDHQLLRLVFIHVLLEVFKQFARF